MPKVIKLIVVTDDDTAGRIDDIAAMSIKERETIPDRFLFERAGVPIELHFVQAEIV